MTALTCSAIVSSHEGGNVTLSTKEQRRLMVLNHLGSGAISGSEAASLLGLSERLAPGSPRPPIPGDWHSRTHAQTDKIVGSPKRTESLISDIIEPQEGECRGPESNWRHHNFQ